MCIYNVGGGSVLKHYSVAAKLEREKLLGSFSSYQFVLPAEAQARNILSRGPAENIYDFQPPSQHPRARVFSASLSDDTPIPTAPDTVRSNLKRAKASGASDQPPNKPCRNSRIKKRYATLSCVVTAYTH